MFQQAPRIRVNNHLARGEEVPLAGNAFQLVRAEVVKIDSRTGDEIFHRAGNNCDAGLGFGHDPRADVGPR
jgi:hypothetical protein